MKKHTAAILSFLCLMALAACGADGGPAGSSETAPPATSADGGPAGSSETAPPATSADGGPAGSSKTAPPATSADGALSSSEDIPDGASFAPESDKDIVVWTLRIVDGAESGSLVLAGQNAGEVYTLPAGNIAVYLDGEPATAAALQDGMMIDVVFDGMVMETYPGQFAQVHEIRAYSLGTKKNPGGSYFDLCGLYLQVLNDLWDRDPGLNSNIIHISLDLSQAPGELTEGEKSAVAWLFGGQHGTDALTLSYEELVQQGYLTEAAGSGDHKLYQWEDGILFTISSAQREEEESYSLPVLKFDARKWRSPLGAYFFTDCFVVWPEMGTWSEYNIGSEAIS